MRYINLHFTLLYFTLLTAKNCKKKQIHQTPSVVGSRSLKVIDIDKSKKHVTRACYDMQQFLCTYLQLFLHCKSQ